MSDTGPDALKERLAHSLQVIEVGMKSTGRKCGACSLCCKVLGIEQPGFTKPADVWCHHCKPGKGGCSIYATRPSTCQAFACGWLVNPAIPDVWNPLRSKIVVHMIPSPFGQLRYVFLVDKAVPNRWRESPYYEAIKEIATKGLTTGKPIRETHVIVGGRKFIVLPNKEVDITGRKLFMLRRVDGVWDVFDSEDESASS